MLALTAIFKAMRIAYPSSSSKQATNLVAILSQISYLPHKIKKDLVEDQVKGKLFLVSTSPLRSIMPQDWWFSNVFIRIIKVFSMYTISRYYLSCF